MSWFSKFFQRRREEPPPAPRPVDPAYQAYLDQKNAPQAPIAAAEPAPYVPPTPIAPVPATPAVNPRWPYGNKRDGTPLRSQAEADEYNRALALRDQNVAMTDVLTAHRFWNGPIPAATLTDDECAFLYYVGANYKWDPTKVQNQGDVWTAILSGPHAEVARAIARGDMKSKAGYNPGAYQGRLRGLVDQVARGLLKPQISYPGLPTGIKDPTK